MRTVIFANGEFNHPEKVRDLIQTEDYLIAADGGLKHVHTLGLSPNLVIGDMDSMGSPETSLIATTPVETIRFPAEKDETDLELAVAEAVKRGGNPILITGALGGRLDLTIANLMLLSHPNLDGVNISIVDGIQEVFVIREHGQVNGAAGDGVSLLALNGPALGVCTAGLQYPLQDEALNPEQARGVSNVMLGEQAEIWVRQGGLLCIHTRKNQ